MQSLSAYRTPANEAAAGAYRAFALGSGAGTPEERINAVNRALSEIPIDEANILDGLSEYRRIGIDTIGESWFVLPNPKELVGTLLDAEAWEKSDLSKGIHDFLKACREYAVGALGIVSELTPGHMYLQEMNPFAKNHNLSPTLNEKSMEEIVEGILHQAFQSRYGWNAWTHGLTQSAKEQVSSLAVQSIISESNLQKYFGIPEEEAKQLRAALLIVQAYDVLHGDPTSPSLSALAKDAQEKFFGILQGPWQQMLALLPYMTHSYHIPLGGSLPYLLTYQDQPSSTETYQELFLSLFHEFLNYGTLPQATDPDGVATIYGLLDALRKGTVVLRMLTPEAPNATLV